MGARRITFGRLSFRGRISGTEVPAIAFSPPMRRQGTRQRGMMPMSLTYIGTRTEFPAPFEGGCIE